MTATDTAPLFASAEDAAALLATVPEPEEVTAPEPDTAPRKRRSGTSGAERARRAKGTTPAADKAPRAPSRPAADDKAVTVGVKGLHELAGRLVLPAVGMPTTGAALVASAPEASEVWVQLARRYPAVRKLFATGGDGVLFVQLFMVYAPLVMLAQSERAAGGAGIDPTALFAGLAQPDAP